VGGTTVVAVVTTITNNACHTRIIFLSIYSFSPGGLKLKIHKSTLLHPKHPLLCIYDRLQIVLSRQPTNAMRHFLLLLALIVWTVCGDFLHVDRWFEDDPERNDDDDRHATAQSNGWCGLRLPLPPPHHEWRVLRKHRDLELRMNRTTPRHVEVAVYTPRTAAVTFTLWNETHRELPINRTTIRNVRFRWLILRTKLD
jgi:hypothetical protein